MRALERKLLRDFLRLWAQGLAIALVLACGVSIFLMSFGMFNALTETRAAYYDRNRFADLFASVQRAPNTLIPEIAAIPGITTVQTRVSGFAVLDLPGRVESASGHFLSLPSAAEPLLNLPLLRSGRVPDPQATDEVMVNEPFAQANGYGIGDRIEANLNGSKRVLTITGTALSPEFIYTIGPGDIMPDNQGFGIFWMPEPALAAAFGMTGAFNDVALRLEAGARDWPVIDALDRLLEPYGSTGAHDRSQQLSNAFIDGELKQLKSMAYVLPPVFFGITVFLVNMVIGRIVSLERSEIGLMKAIGYSNTEISLHYVFLALLIALVGVAAGFAAGSWFSRGMARMYAEFFNFPYLIFSVSGGVYVAAGAMGLVTAATGAVSSALRAARLPPAVAMAPPAPPSYRKTGLDRVLAWVRVSQPTMMILRNVMRWPLRAGLTTLGIALAVAVLVASSFFEDSLEEMIDLSFHQANRQDATLLFNAELGAPALEEVARLPGVMQVEAVQFRDVVLRTGHLHKRVSLEGRPANADLSRIVDTQGRPVTPTGNGILLSERLAQLLAVVPGDTIAVEFQSGLRETHKVRVSGVVTNYIGLAAYMELDTLDRLMRRAPRAGGANLMLDPTRQEAFHAAAKTLPRLAGTVMLGDTLASFRETIEQNISITTMIYVAIAVLITVGVTYNSARIQLSERARDLASLRILGFTTGEVSYILIGETAVLVLLAQPLGWLLGAGLASAMVAGFASDLYSIPLVLNRDTFAWSSCVVMVAAAVSALLVRRRLNRLKLVDVMKTRE